MSVFSKLFGKEKQLQGDRSAERDPQLNEVFKVCTQKLLEKDYEGARGLLTPILANGNFSANDRAQAYFMRGKSQAHLGNLEGGIADCTQAISIALNNDLKAEALCLRAECKSIAKNGDWRIGMEDLSEAIALPGVGVEQRSLALIERGLSRHYTGDFKGAFADHTAAIALPGVSAERRARALLARAETKIELFDESGELEDYNTVLEKMSGVPATERARALYRRGYFYQWVTRNDNAAKADYEAVLATPGASQQMREAAINSLESIGVDYSEERKIVDQMRAQLRASSKQ